MNASVRGTSFETNIAWRRYLDRGCRAGAGALGAEWRKQTVLIQSRCVPGFFVAVGKKGGDFWDESGPSRSVGVSLKVLRAFHLTIHHDGKAIPAETWCGRLKRTGIDDSRLFGRYISIREKFFVPGMSGRGDCV